MAGHLPPARVRVARCTHCGEQHLQWRFAEMQTERAVAIIEKEPIVAGSHDQPGRDENGFVSGARDLKEDLVLALELNLLVVDAPREQHRPICANELLRCETAGALALGSRLNGHSPANSPFLRAHR